MSLEDQIAKQLLRKHATVLGNFTKNADGWYLDLQKQAEEPIHQYQRCAVVFGKDHHARLDCQIADDPELQVIGLAKHASLAPNEGMIFTWPEPHRANFHMSTVPFPIDMIFVGSDGRVTKKIERIEPGAEGMWGMPHTSAVIEANGGFCSDNNIEVGCEVYELSEKQAQETYTPTPRKDINPKMLPPNTTHDRYRSKDLVDKQVEDQPMDPAHREEQWGYDSISIDPDDPNIVPTRMSP